MSIYEKWPQRPETGIRDGFEESEHEFPTYSDVPFLAEIFHWNDPKGRVPFTFQSDSEMFCKF